MMSELWTWCPNLGHTTLLSCSTYYTCPLILNNKISSVTKKTLNKKNLARGGGGDPRFWLQGDGEIDVFNKYIGLQDGSLID